MSLIPSFYFTTTGFAVGFREILLLCLDKSQCLTKGIGKYQMVDFIQNSLNAEKVDFIVGKPLSSNSQLYRPLPVRGAANNSNGIRLFDSDLIEGGIFHFHAVIQRYFLISCHWTISLDWPSFFTFRTGKQ